MEFIIWGVGATILGLGLGYLGYLYSKLAYSIFITSIGVITFFSKYLVDLTGGDAAGLAAMHTDSGGMIAAGILKNIMSSIGAMGYLPTHVQVAIIICAVAFFGARIATWAHESFGSKPAEETAAARKARVLASYGMTSMDDVRKIR